MNSTYKGIWACKCFNNSVLVQYTGSMAMSLSVLDDHATCTPTFTPVYCAVEPLLHIVQLRANLAKVLLGHSSNLPRAAEHVWVLLKCFCTETLRKGELRQ